MEDTDIQESFLALIIFSFLFLFTTAGTLLAGTNPDSVFIYIEFDPPEDLTIIIIILLLDSILLLLFLSQAFKFRESRNLNKRQIELLLISDKMKYYCIYFIPLQGFLIYFYVKYFKTAIAIHLFLMLLFEISIIILIFYNSFIINRDNE